MLIELMQEDCQSGLCQADRMLEARKNLDYYNGYFLPHWNAIEEGELHPLRTSMFMQAQIDGISNLYKFDASRVIPDNPVATAWYQNVMTANNMGNKFATAERMAAIGGFAAFGVSGVRNPEVPVKITLWTADTLAVYCSPDDPTVPTGVTTVDNYNGRKRYQLWTDEKYQVFMCEKPGDPAACIMHEDKPNPYGVLPFCFVSHKPQVMSFFAGFPGTNLMRANHFMNIRLSKMGQACRFLMEPLAIAYGTTADFEMPSPYVPGDLIKMTRDPDSDQDPSIVFQAPDPSFVEAGWQDNKNFEDHTASSNGIPYSATEMLGGVARSGVSVMMDKWPLVSASRAKQPQWKEYEYNLAKLVFTVSANWLKANNVTKYPIVAETAKNLKLSITYSESFVAEAPGAERDRACDFELQRGYKSKLQIYQERTGCSREQAMEHFIQVAEDNKFLASIGAMPADAKQVNDGTEEENGDDAIVGQTSDGSGAGSAPGGQGIVDEGYYAEVIDEASEDAFDENSISDLGAEV